MAEPSPALLDLLSKVIQGRASIDDLADQIRVTAAEKRSPPRATSDDSAGPDEMLPIAGATVDLGRVSRCGFGEVIYGEGKPAELIARIAQTQLAAGQPVLVTRLDAAMAAGLQQTFVDAHHDPLARTLRICPTGAVAATSLSLEQAGQTIHAAVVSAGSTDAAVAAEAAETLAWMGVPVQRFDDIGVAGPQRLAAAIPRLRLAAAVVVVAGMEGALPSVVAGHLSAPVFAVPTSVGYGATLGGLTPLLGMLSSCAASVAVVNIDAGFKAGYLAGLVVRQLQNLSDAKRT